jgi:hypothetical protein
MYDERQIARAVDDPNEAKRRFIEAAVANFERTSRTKRGVSDTSSSTEKPELKASGGGLADRATDNFRRAIERLYDERGREFRTVDEVRTLIEEVAQTVSDGLLKEGQGLWRTWATKFANQPPPERIADEMDNFVHTLAGRLGNSHDDAVATAAFIEKRLDGEIHPFADGCGRTAKALSAFVLARAGKPLPVYHGREEYYREVYGTDEEWERYYRSLFPEQ